MTRDARTPVPSATPGGTPAADPTAPVFAGGSRIGETVVVAAVAHTQSPLLVADSTVAPGLVAPRPAAANPNVDTPVVHSQAPVAPSAISQAAAQHDPALAAVARVTETAAITPAGLPQAPAATIDGTETTGSASAGPKNSPRVTGTAAPAPTVPHVTVDTSPVALITANFPGTASAPAPTVTPAPGEAVDPAAIQPRVRRRRGDSELVAPAEARRSPTTMPGSVTPHDQATPVPTTVTRKAETTMVPGAPPYALLPTPYSPPIEPIPHPLTSNPHPLLPTPYPLLRVTIGRIDVRVTAPPPAASTRREPTRPTVSLDDYLSGGGSPP